jgi:hypothetical protein
MNDSSQEIQHVVQRQMESLDDADTLSSVWKDALSSATEATSFRQQALLWYVLYFSRIKSNECLDIMFSHI